MKYFALSLLFISLNIHTYAQDGKHLVSDSLINIEYKSIRDSVTKYNKDYEKVDRYATTYLIKAKRDKDTLRMGQGYFIFINYHPNNETKLLYLDSVINVTKNKLSNVFHTEAYLYKAYLYDKKHDYQKAIENYSNALNLAIKNNKIDYIQSIKFQIGKFNSTIGEYDKALTLFNECYQISLKENYKKNVQVRYLASINGLADTYNRLMNTDSASYYNKLGYTESVSLNDEVWRNFATYTEGTNQYHLKNYQAAIDSLSKSIPLIIETKDKRNLTEAYNNIGMSYYLSNNKETGIIYLTKMDSLVRTIDYSYYELRRGYETLINYYKSKNNSIKQLELINSLLRFDSIQNSNYKVIAKEINNQYGKPKLLKEKEKLIDSLNKSKSGLTRYLLISTILIALITIISIFQFIRHRTYKKKYKKLKINEIINSQNTYVKPQTIENISKENVSSIINGLNDFEKKLGFLANGLTLKKLAVSIKTNTTYLSKVINYYKDKNFSSYINELRINHFLKVVPDNSKLQNYTISALAKEFGYNNTESFSIAFYKQTGIKPSFYIKQLKKDL